MQESLDVFRDTWFNRWLNHVSIILFLNKYDIFVEKILCETIQLEEFFPDYNQYIMPDHVNKAYRVEDENPAVTRAKLFVLKKFIDITYESADTEKEKEFLQSASTIVSAVKQDASNRLRRSFETNNIYATRTKAKKFCIPYFTCAVDTDNIQRVFKGCCNILQREHLEKFGLLQ